MHGDYRITVTDTDGTGNGCNTVINSTITQSTPPTLTVSDDSLSNVTNCASLDNGYYEVREVQEGGATVATVGSYTYELYNSGGTLAAAANTTGVFSGLDVDNYDLVITRNSSQCSSTVSVDITDDSNSPNISLTATDNTKCDATADGSITANFVVAPGNTDYSFAWYVSATGDIGDTGSATLINNGDAVNSVNVVIGDNGGFTGNVLSGLAANTASQTYWVRVTDTSDPNNTCFADVDQIIVDDPNDITVSATPTDATSCTPRNGTIVITQVDETTLGGGAITGSPFSGNDISANYTLQLYKDVSGTWTLQPGAFTNETAASLDSGAYYVNVLNSDGCISTNVSLNVGFVDNSPTVADTPTPNSTCIGSTAPVGAFALNVNGGAVTTGYTFAYEYDRANGAGFETITTGVAKLSQQVSLVLSNERINNF